MSAAGGSTEGPRNADALAAVVSEMRSVASDHRRTGSNRKRLASTIEGWADALAAAVLSAPPGDARPPTTDCAKCGHPVGSHYQKYMGQMAGDDVPFCARCQTECEYVRAAGGVSGDATVMEAVESEPWVDTPVLAAQRRAFDAPTVANLDALIEAVRQECAGGVSGDTAAPDDAALLADAKDAAEEMRDDYKIPAFFSWEPNEAISRMFSVRYGDHNLWRAAAAAAAAAGSSPAEGVES